MYFITDILQDTIDSDAFRRVLHTGATSQLVTMSIPPLGEIGMETHDRVAQTIVIVRGSARAILDGERRMLHAGDILMIPPGTEHNILNEGAGYLKLYTVYSPPNHIDGRIHQTKEDADRDEEDEAFGHAKRNTLTESARPFFYEMPDREKETDFALGHQLASTLSKNDYYTAFGF